MTAPRYIVSFLIGVVIGAASLFLFLQSSGRLVTVTSAVKEVEVALPAQPAGVPVPVEPGREVPSVGKPAPFVPEVATATYTSVGSLAIPVVGKKPTDLADHFLDLRGGGRPHHAIDIMAPRGTPVVAVVDGTIRKLHLSVPGGITLYQTDPDQEWIYYYAHLDSYAQGLVEGKTVRRGEVIGYVGSTGNAGDPHLHFGISRLPPTKEWWKGVAVNPYPILRARGVTVQGAGLSR